MSESEYKKLVLAEYTKKRASGGLPAELSSPTPASVKAQAVKLCGQDFNSKDEITLESFVNRREGMAAYKLALQNCNADIFRPIVTFLKDPSVNTNFKNVQLLAWLIDFKPRPYYTGLIIPENTGKKKPTGEPSSKGTISAAITPPIQFPGTRRKISMWLLIPFVFIICATAYFLTKSTKRHYTGTEGCMVWNHDEYEPIECNERSTGILYPINHELVDHFKRITEPDTLTAYSVGKVWYANNRGRVDFYTHSGPYPLDTNFRVLPMSRHILDKYVLHLAN